MKPSGEVILERKQPGGLGVHVKKATREPRGAHEGGGRALGVGPPPYLVASLFLS